MKKKIIVYSLICSCFILACSRDSDDTSEPGTVDRRANLLGTGASANDFLANTNFDDLLIEIAYVEGFRPTAQTISNFETFLRETTFKTDIEFTYKALPSPNEETLELDEIVDLENENRTVYNNGRTLAVYIYFANSPSDSDDEDEGLVTLGAVYRNTSMVIYESTIRSLASRGISITLTDVESATLNHEFGHLLGLVNLGTTPVNDHEDTTTNDDGNEEGNNHCNVAGCLMRAELQFGGSTNKNSGVALKSGLHSACNLSGMGMMKLLQQQASRGLPIVPVLDAECILDLQNNGGR